MDIESKQPKVSVVVVVGAVRHRAERCLRAVLDQIESAGRPANGPQAVEPLEFLVVDRRSDLGPLAGSEHPCVRTVAVPADSTFGESRARGVTEARGEIVAFLEEHAMPGVGWLQAVVGAFADEEWSGVGPAVRNGNPNQGLSDITFTIGYAFFAQRSKRGMTPWIPSHNSSFRRRALLELESDLPLLLESENLMRRVLWRRGHRFFFEPGAVVFHWNESELRGTPILFFHYHRVEAWLDRRFKTRSWWRRWAPAVGFPLLPFYSLWLFYWRHRWSVEKAERSPLRLKHMGSYFATQTLGALGRALGTVMSSIGQSRHRMTDLELTLPRGGGDLPAEPARQTVLR